MSKQTGNVIAPKNGNGNIKQWGGVQNFDNYLRGELEKQKENGVVKTQNDIYDGINCGRDNFTKTLMLDMQHYRKKDLDVKAKVYTFTYSPNDITEHNLTPQLAHKISMELANKYFKDYTCLCVTHIDSGKFHTQCIVGNCNIHDGSSFQQSNKMLENMKIEFGKKLMEHGLTNSISMSKDKNEKYKEVKNNNGEIEKIYYEKPKEKSFNEIKMEERIGKRNTNKNIIGEYLHKFLQKAKTVSELKGMLQKYKITMAESGRKHFVFSHPDAVNKKGEIMKFRETNLGDYSTTRENIEKQLDYNLKNEKGEKGVELHGNQERGNGTIGERTAEPSRGENSRTGSGVEEQRTGNSRLGEVKRELERTEKEIARAGKEIADTDIRIESGKRRTKITNNELSNYKTGAGELNQEIRKNQDRERTVDRGTGSDKDGKQQLDRENRDSGEQSKRTDEMERD